MAIHSKYHITKEETFNSHLEEKAHIYVKHYLPKEGVKPSQKYYHLIFQHGMIEYHGNHEEFLESIKNEFGQKVIVSVMDLVGHGLSGGVRAYIDRFDTFCLDMVRFFKCCSKHFSKEQISKRVMVSHSLGGLIVLKTVASEAYKLPFKFDKLVFVNPCISPKLNLPDLTVAVTKKIPQLLRQIKIPLIYSANDLTQDEQSAISFMHDHLISKSVTIKLALETLEATEGINSLSYFIKTPSLFLFSGDDSVVDNEKAKLFVTGMDKKVAESKTYPNMKHDLLNETCRKDVFKEIIKWIKKS